MKKVSCFLFLLACSLQIFAVTVDPKQCVIQLPPEADGVKCLAAKELAKHLHLIAGQEIPIVRKNILTDRKYIFRVGIPPFDNAKPFAPEEARTEVAENGVWLYGDDFEGGDLLGKACRTGSLFAVYDFLEKQFQVRWIEPGDRGIVYAPMEKLQLKEGSYSWNPGHMFQRAMRCGVAYDYADYRRCYSANVPGTMQLNEQEYKKKIKEIRLFFKRHKMGNSRVFPYGHAFVKWWSRYGKSNPGYFAMQENGRRGLQDPQHPTWSKLCVSSPQVQDQVIRDWMRLNPRPKVLNVSENDAGGYCRCPECLKLDVRKPGEKFGSHLTDRYLHFANSIQKKVAEIDPEVSVFMYIYSDYRYPPRREKADPRLLLGFVPGMLEYDQVAMMYGQWKKAGAKNLMLRPNDQHVNTGLPMGFEKLMFDHFQLGVKNGVVASDYDSCHNFWPATGIADYILLRAHSDPSKTFEYWEQEYCSAYGDAAEAVRDYYRYFRNEVWEKRLYPNRMEIQRLGRYGNFRRGIMWNIAKFYAIEDFDRTDEILNGARNKRLTESERSRLENLILANQHARLTYQAIVAKNKFLPGRKLLRFREVNKDRLSFDWNMLCHIEKLFGDLTGVALADALRSFSDMRETPYRWSFRIDPNCMGEKEKWERNRLCTQTGKLPGLRTDRSWERQVAKEIGAELHEQLANYDGVGYYMTDLVVPEKWRDKEIFLYFGGVDESAKIWINGKFAHERLHKDHDDWRKPFTVLISHLINWDLPRQNVVVRVHDQKGDGGIWKRVYLVCRDKTQ